MEHLIYKNLKKIELSGIRKFTNMLVDYPNAINLTIGQPDFPTPTHIKEKAKLAIDQNFTSYTPNAGIVELRKAIGAFYDSQYGLSYNPQDEIIVTHGASGALTIALRTILEEGCEVILSAPAYPGYIPLIELCGAIPVCVDTEETGFVLTAALIEKHITEKTRCIILPSPCNPVGTIIEEAELQKIALLLKEKEIFIISDEIYSELTYENAHKSITSFEGMRHKTIVINGVSKSHSMTGWRIGYTLAPSYLTKEMTKLNGYYISCASSISQYAALAALTDGVNDPLAMKEEYKVRRDYVYERLITMGLDVVKPAGAFYIFPSIKKTNMASFDFCLDLLKEQELATVPGSAFSQYGEGYIRLSFAQPLEVLQKGMDRLEKFMKKFN
ncbi:aminotransferase A [Ureibacillus sinduriensis]|uniref:Aminotransferase n=1 Tax=Ureibacillus sinduriensis BLB-1 = JCM 15800 TaxID=1384057 RepID=A0A0A3I061_9BACL|nr:aminotransferase A [Ureibacillus sinduriensis]KGR78114.1 aromatic amino acid aminotransferase [Ureibacillus sinduriensis BLB-1 = JCM 15800]